MSRRVLYLTDNPNLGSTVRILQNWLLIGRDQGTVEGYVAAPSGSTFLGWLAAHQIPFTVCPFPVPSKRWPWPALYHAVRLGRWMRQHRIQVIHCNEHNIYPFAALLRFVTRCPLACHVRYLVSREYAQWAFGGRRRRPDALLWTSRQQRMDCAEAIRGVVPEECQHLVPLGLDPALYGSRQSDRDRVRAGWGVEPGDVVIGQATALRPRKRIEDFIELIARLAEEDSRVVGVLAGDAPPGDEAYRAEVLKHIQRRQLGRRFQWIGHIDDVEPFDHALDVFVSTSEYETFGNSVCEAMACARPVVAYQGGSVKEIVGDSGIIVDNGDLPALTNAVRECVRRPELRATLGRAGLHRVLNEFSPTSTLAQLCVIYEKLLRERPDSIGGPP